MSNVTKITEYYSKKENKEKLVALIKANGSYLRLCPTNGYVYSVNVGSVEGHDIFLEVGIKSGNTVILNPTSSTYQKYSTVQ